MSPTKCRLGIDTGGTFTDCVTMDETTGEFSIDKVPSTPSDPSLSFSGVLSRALGAIDAKIEDVSFLVHGTTVATNCIIEGKTAKCGLVTTRGFRDILEIARQIKPEPYNIFFEKPRPLVPRRLCVEIEERLDYEGKVISPINPITVLQAADTFKNQGVESVAVCLLHSYVNPKHERLVQEMLLKELPGVYVSVSADVCPEFREYFRASTTVVNAAIVPIVAGYLDRIESRLASWGFKAQLCVMQSNGGVYTSEIARRNPVHLIESGPAAGVTVAAYIGSLTGSQNVISLDIGGTTAKVGLILDGSPKFSTEFEVGSKAVGRSLHAKATGYPIKSSVIDLVEIGAGGGSIGWVDSGGALRVGPQSAGAEPGPACYAKGGTLPTLTDANLILGRLNPDFFLGGEMKLSIEKASQAVEELASMLNLSVTEAAAGMVEIANANMIEALRLVSIQRGFDPREFALVAFGGAGPLHANALAGELSISEVVIPLSPGVSSALGLLVADLKHDFVRTYIKPIDRADLNFVESAFQEFERESRELLNRENIPSDRQSFSRELDLRYSGQSFELTIRLDPGPLEAEHLASLKHRFDKSHEVTYGHSTPGESIEIVNLRVRARGIIPKPKLKLLAHANGKVRNILKGERKVCFLVSEGFVATPIFDRYQLRADDRIAGPAIVEELDSTTVIYPGYQGRIDEFGSIHISSSGNQLQ
jgi:N-methylhydantoinase A